MKKVLSLLLLLLVIALPLCACRANDPLLGVWWWKDTLGDEYLKFAKDSHVTEIYFCTGNFNEKTDTFVKKANDYHMKVYWLTGSYKWINDNQLLFNQMDKFLAYQQKYQHKFEGVHFDIEPQQSPEYKAGDRQGMIEKFVQLTYTLKDKYPDLWIEYDLPFWMHDQVTIGTVTKPAYEHVIDNASRVTLMSYRDSADKIYSCAKEEIAYAQSVGKTLNLGVATKNSGEGDAMSFEEEGKLYMYAELAKLRKMIPKNFGIVIHQIVQWYDLKD